MEGIPACRVRFLLDEESVYFQKKHLNVAELKAMEMSMRVFCNNKYYDIESFAFNADDFNTLEVRLK
ncbi:hypothetical protein [Clostridium sp. DL1XJH146]